MFFTNVRFTKKISFCERFKLRPVLSMKNTPFTFFAFFPRLHVNFLKKFHLLILEELRNLHAKIDTFSVKIDREINFQSWILFFIDFSLMLQLCHSALGLNLIVINAHPTLFQTLHYGKVVT